MSAIRLALGLDNVVESEMNNGKVLSASTIYRLQRMLAQEIATFPELPDNPVVIALHKGRVEILSQLINESYEVTSSQED